MEVVTMTLFGMIIFFIVTLLWIFIGELILSHLINKKGYNISSLWEWHLLWFLGLLDLLDTDKNP